MLTSLWFFGMTDQQEYMSENPFPKAEISSLDEIINTETASTKRMCHDVRRNGYSDFGFVFVRRKNKYLGTPPSMISSF